MPFFSMYTVLNDMTPNDSKAGESYRESYPESQLCKMYPNDSDLGAKIRTLTEAEFNKVTYPEILGVPKRRVLCQGKLNPHSQLFS